MNEKKETTLNEAIIKIKVELQEKKLKQSGKNTFAGFTYFELSDFLPTLNKLMQENGVNDQIIINREYAEMTLHKGSESQTYTIPFADTFPVLSSTSFFVNGLLNCFIKSLIIIPSPF